MSPILINHEDVERMNNEDEEKVASANEGASSFRVRYGVVVGIVTLGVGIILTV